jgi:hypothetical protein
MTPEEKAELYALCERVVVEKDPVKFHQLLVQLNDLLEKKERRLEHPKPKVD